MNAENHHNRATAETNDALHDHARHDHAHHDHAHHDHAHHDHAHHDHAHLQTEAHVHPNSRGMAVFLALVAVALALMVGLAISSTRDASTSASGGLVLATSSRSASAGALDIAEFIVQKHSPSIAGVASADARFVFEPKRLGNYTLSADMRDPTTGGAPTEESVGLALSASAASGTVTQSASDTVRIDWADTDDRADLDLSEFAIFTAGGTSTNPALRIGPNSEVSVWRKAPLAKLGEPVVIGHRTRTTSLFTIDPQARLLGHVLVRPGGFPTNQMQLDEQLANQELTIPFDVQVPATPRQNAPTIITVLPFARFAADVNTRLPDGTLPHIRTSVPNQHLWNLNSVVTIAATNDASLQPNTLLPLGTWRVIHLTNQTMLRGARWRFEVPTQLIVDSNLRLVDSEFTVGPNGALTIQTAGELSLQNSRIVPDDGNRTTSHAADGTADYGAFGASRIIVYSHGGSPALTSRSVLKGQIYATGLRVRVESQSAVYGRILASTAEFTGGGSLYYDPQLNSGRGWTNPKSGVWWRRDELRPEVRGVGILNDQGLATFVTRTGVAVELPENGIVVTQHVGAAGGVPRINSNGAQAGALTSAATAIAQSVAAAPRPMVYPDRFIVVHGTLRDFREMRELEGHPDFDNPQLARNATWSWLASGLVERELSPDGKPILAKNTVKPLQNQHIDSRGRAICWTVANKSLGDRMGTPVRLEYPYVASPESFATWFRDTPGVNLVEPFRIVMRRVMASAGVTTYVFDSNAAPPFQNDGPGPQFDGFFPVENRLFGNSALASTLVGTTLIGWNRNYHFTLELSLEFTYRSGTGQAFSFNSDDDLWAFIDGKLVIDLGGMHSNSSQMVELDRLGLVEGKTYPMKIFYAERRRPYSYFRMATTFPIASPIPEAPPLSDPMGPLVNIYRQSDMTRMAFLSRK
jgi:fibro-slime domain-containing protein